MSEMAMFQQLPIRYVCKKKAKPQSAGGVSGL
jgi:hypothetical protein